MNLQFTKLTTPTQMIVEKINRWENNDGLIPLTRPNQNKAELEKRHVTTLKELRKRMENHHIYLIYLDDQFIGEMNFMINPGHLYKKEPGTAWIGIMIGEPEARGKGIGYQAIQFLEQQIKQQGFNRIELGVFEFNTRAQKLYKELGYKEITRIKDFTYWQGKMWADVRMEKYLTEAKH